MVNSTIDRPAEHLPGRPQQGHQLDDLVLPDDALPSFRVTEPNDVPSAWGVVFAQL